MVSSSEHTPLKSVTKAISGKTFQAKDIAIKNEGSIEAGEIDELMLVGRHYSIVSKAALEKPTKLNILLHKIKEFFGVDGDEAVKVGKIFDAKDACEKLQIDEDAMDERRETCQEAHPRCNLGQGRGVDGQEHDDPKRRADWSQ